jgi:PhnB protein
MSTFIPEGWHSITPRLVVHDPAKVVQFLKFAFDATGDYSEGRPAVMKIGDSILMVSGVGPRDPFSICMSKTPMQRISAPWMQAPHR